MPAYPSPYPSPYPPYLPLTKGDLDYLAARIGDAVGQSVAAALTEDRKLRASNAGLEVEFTHGAVPLD